MKRTQEEEEGEAILDIFKYANTQTTSEEDDSSSLDDPVLPTEMLQAIGKVSVGVMLRLARTSKVFADLTRSDAVWRQHYQRDFPNEYAFCGNQLPFFVMTENHPLYINGDIDTRDRPAWKRLYFITSMYYTFMYKEFALENATRSAVLFRNQVVGLNLEDRSKPLATAKDIYNWCHRYILGEPLRDFYEPVLPTVHDWRADICWYLVCGLAWFVANITLPQQRQNVRNVHIIRLVWNRLASQAEYAWLRPYIWRSLFSFEFVAGRLNPINVMAEALNNPNLPAGLQVDQNAQLFSQEDFERLSALIQTESADPDFSGFVGLNATDLMRNQMRDYAQLIVLLCYRAYAYPCIFSYSIPENAFQCVAQDLCRFYFSNLVQQGHQPIDLRPSTGALDMNAIQADWRNRLLAMYDLRTIIGRIKPGFFAGVRRMPFLTGMNSVRWYADLFIEFSQVPRVSAYLTPSSKVIPGAIRWIEAPAGFGLICAQCSASLSPKIARECGGTTTCGTVYCNQECADAHWETHKKNAH